MKRGEMIINILMERDGLSKMEAAEQYEQTRQEFSDALEGKNCRDPEDVLAEDLGLEPDYIFEFI